MRGKDAPVWIVVAATVLAVAGLSACGTGAPTKARAAVVSPASTRSGASSAGGAPTGAAATTTTTTQAGGPGHQLFDTDFTGVCQGATVSRARAYDHTAKTGHKVLYFSPYGSDLVEGSLIDMPDDWKVTFDPNADAYAAVDLVACAERTSDKFVRTCTGYKDGDKPTQNVARVHTATYKLTIHEATTGVELGTINLAGTDGSCPLFVSFNGDSDTVEYYADPPSDKVIAFIRPFAQP
jgi:hypothetical protein